MLRYPVDVAQDTNGEFTATLADLPSFPAGRGATAEEAYKALFLPAIDHLTRLLIKGGDLPPSEANGRPVIGVDKPQRFAGRGPVDVLWQDTKRGRMINYSWTSHIVFRDW